jgi:beta-glucosidase
VLFPFGHGSSYTTFQYTSPRVSSTTFKDVAGVTVTVDVTNTGSVAGKEIVQLYVRDHASKLARPPKELKAFAKVALAPGETRTLSFPLDFRAFAYYHPAYDRWITEDGAFDILIGASSADIRCTLTVTLQATLRLPTILNRESTIREWLEDPGGKAALEPHFGEMMAQAIRVFGNDLSGNGGNGGSGPGDPGVMGVLEMPLLSVLHFQEGRLPVPADALVDALLKEVYGKESPVRELAALTPDR